MTTLACLLARSLPCFGQASCVTLGKPQAGQNPAQSIRPGTCRQAVRQYPERRHGSGEDSGFWFGEVDTGRGGSAPRFARGPPFDDAQGR